MGDRRSSLLFAELSRYQHHIHVKDCWKLTYALHALIRRHVENGATGDAKGGESIGCGRGDFVKRFFLWLVMRLVCWTIFPAGSVAKSRGNNFPASNRKGEGWRGGARNFPQHDCSDYPTPRSLDLLTKFSSGRQATQISPPSASPSVDQCIFMSCPQTAQLRAFS